MISAKTLVKDKFWILEQDGEKLGTLQKKDNNGWIFLSKKDQSQVFHTQESLFAKFGAGLFNLTSAAPAVVHEEAHDVHGYPVSQKPFNSMFDVQKQLPIYTKASKSKSLFCAGWPQRTCTATQVLVQKKCGRFSTKQILLLQTSLPLEVLGT